MKRWSSVALAGILLIPAAADAQRPSNNVHTRSVEQYLSTAAAGKSPADSREAYEKALVAARNGVQNDPDNSKVWFQLGTVLAGLNQFIAADSAFDRAEQMWPEYAEETERDRLRGWIASYNAAAAALNQNDYATAMQSLIAADALYQKRPEALVTLGSLYVQAEEPAKAEDAFRRALAIIRGPASEGLNEEQKKAWAEDELSVSMRLATVLNEQERYADAETVYRDLLRTQPDNVMAKTNLAVVLNRAGKAEEATTVYKELLTRDDLPESSLFNIGIGLFRAQQFSDAATAFRRAVEANAYSHDSLYNLSQALLAVIGDIERSAETAPDAQKAAAKAQVVELYTEVLALTDRLRALDPTNRNVLMMRAQAQRMIGESKTGAEADTWRQNVLATLEEHKAIPFEVMEIVTSPGETDTQVTGRVLNLTAPEGSDLTIRFTIIDREGTELVSENITVKAAVPEEATRFTHLMTVPEGAAAWKYEVVR